MSVPVTRVLVVDDQADVRSEIVECLGTEGFVCIEAESGEDGLSHLRADEDISIVVSDFLMPGKTGVEMIEAAKSEHGLNRDIEYVILTGHGGNTEVLDCLRLGVIDFLSKPIDPSLLIMVVRRAEEIALWKRNSRNYRATLETEVQQKTLEIRRLLTNLENAYSEAIKCLAVTSEYKDEETAHHSRRIGEYARLIAKQLGWPDDRQNLIELAAPLHDLGKVGTPDSILLKPGQLNPEELEVMRQHASNGYEILKSSKHPAMKMAAEIARTHHERWDGTGYPRGLKGSEIPIEGRIVAVADVYDALRSPRPYKPSFDHDKALQTMLEGDGRTQPGHFDPDLLRLIQAHGDEFDAIYLRHPD